MQVKLWRTDTDLDLESSDQMFAVTAATLGESFCPILAREREGVTFDLAPMSPLWLTSLTGLNGVM